MSSYCRCSGKITTRRRVCGRVTTTAPSTSLARFQAAMNDAHDTRHITTEIATAKPFYYAEDDHQQYLYKNPHGYCGIGGIGVCLPPQ